MSVQAAKNPPKIGQVVTVSYAGYWEDGKLKYPYFLRERNDRTWEEIKNTFTKDNASSS